MVRASEEAAVPIPVGVIEVTCRVEEIVMRIGGGESIVLRVSWKGGEESPCGRNQERQRAQ